MNAKVDWIVFLNEQSEWRSRQDLGKFLCSFLGRSSLELSDESIESFSDALAGMRRILYDSHFDCAPDFAWLSTELQSVKLKLNWVPQARESLRLIAYTDLDHERSSGDEMLLSSLLAELILRFSLDLSDSFRDESKFPVQRCEGLYREQGAGKLSSIPGVSDDIELKWREELEILVEKSQTSNAELQRCADLFSANSRSKFCSDKCRFSTFQIVKQLKDPAYLADKQRRYRQKKN